MPPPHQANKGCGTWTWACVAHVSLRLEIECASPVVHVILGGRELRYFEKRHHERIARSVGVAAWPADRARCRENSDPIRALS